MIPGKADVIFNEARRIPGDDTARSLVHPFSAFLLVIVDSLWNFADWNILAWLITIPLAFLSVCIPAILIERQLNHHSLPKALAIGFFLGVVAGVPTSVLGTPFGATLLAWAGVKRLIQMKRGK
jgi:hypothetical protein